MNCDRYWLLTWHTYGTWLPGEERGFVGTVRDAENAHVIHNVPGTPVDADSPHLAEWSRQQLKCSPIYLGRKQAECLAPQLLETAGFRNWKLFALAIVNNHVHVVVGVPGDPEPEKLLGDFKSYGSRALNRLFGKPRSETWWTESGSKRKLPHETAVLGAIRYVRNQHAALVVWTASIPELNLREGFHSVRFE